MLLTPHRHLFIYIHVYIQMYTHFLLIAQGDPDWVLCQIIHTQLLLRAEFCSTGGLRGEFTASTGDFEESFIISFPAAILTNLMGGNHARGRGKMRLLKSEEENIRLFDRTENEAQLGKTYCLENDNG